MPAGPAMRGFRCAITVGRSGGALGKIFSRFSGWTIRAIARRRVGLGLAIAHRAVTLHTEAVGENAQPGLRVWIELPLAGNMEHASRSTREGSDREAARGGPSGLFGGRCCARSAARHEAKTTHRDHARPIDHGSFRSRGAWGALRVVLRADYFEQVSRDFRTTTNT